MDIGIDPFLISSTLDSIIAQRLVRSLCEECKEVVPPFSPQYKKLGISPDDQKLYKAKGCPDCDDSGFKGRSVIYEILKISPSLREMINEKTNLEEIRRQATEEGFIPMREVALEKIRMGITTLDEVNHATRLEI
jgi:type II secretory ATPase GspE/PulE/Tfp pilus assembly ATPase PilB-like protein